MVKKVYGSGEGKIEISFDDAQTWLVLDDVETFEMTVDGKVVEWTPHNGGGWGKNYFVGKTLKVALEKKYNPSADGDKEIVTTALTKSAYSHNYVQLRFTLPLVDSQKSNAAYIDMEASLNVEQLFASGSEDVAPLKCNFLVNGAPTYNVET